MKHIRDKSKVCKRREQRIKDKLQAEIQRAGIQVSSSS